MRDSTILITGGTSGIGRALAAELHRTGNTVVVCGRRTERLAALAEQYPALVTRECDVASAEDRARLVEWVLEAHPDLNVLINNAGVQLRFDATAPADLDRVWHELEVNLVAPLHLSSLLVGQLTGRPGATIVNVTSGLAFAPMAAMGVYCASKAAVHSLTQSLRHQCRGLGIRVVELAPPAVDTELGADRRSDPDATHGGMPLDEFVAHAMRGLASPHEEVLVGFAARARSAPDEMFAFLNR